MTEPIRIDGQEVERVCDTCVRYKDNPFCDGCTDGQCWYEADWHIIARQKLAIERLNKELEMTER